MPKPANVDPPVRLVLKLPQSIRTRIDLLLFSPLEGRVPQGKYQEFFLERIREFFDWKKLDLSPYGLPPGSYISGPKAVLDDLERRLKGG